MRLFHLITWLLFTSVFCLGFRVFPDIDVWDINNSSATESKIFVSYSDGSRVLKNDVEDSDPLFGPSTVTVKQIMDSIFADYSSVDATFVTLTDTADADYNLSSAINHSINIDFGNSSGTTAGEAKTEVKDGQIVGCSINIDDKHFDSAEVFIRTMTHELGHCLGLDHPQETQQAVMSYYSGDNVIRLQMDDKMGLVYLYPVDKNKAQESSTLGLSCEESS